MTDKKTKYVKVKMTPEEYWQWKDKAKPFGSMTTYIRSAVAEFSNVSSRERLDLMNRLHGFCESWTPKLGHMVGNFNQTVKRANELAQCGLLTEEYMQTLMDMVQEAQTTLHNIYRELRIAAYNKPRT